MEPLNLMVTLTLVSDDVRREATGHGSGTGHADGRRKSHALWSALRRSVTARKSSAARPVVVSESSGD